MANAIGTNGTHERQERYANAIVKLMRPQLRIRNTFSRDYEGNPVSGAVKVPVRNTDVKIVDYDVKSGVALSQSATTYKNIPVDNHKAINELIDGYESQAVPDNLVAQRLESGAYVIASTLEADAIKALTTGTTDSTMADCTADNVYANILADIAEIAKLGVDKSRIRVAISYATELLLLTDEKFSNTSSQIGAELAREGVVGRINGVNVLTQDLGQVASKDVEYIVYAIDWCQAIDEWMIEPTINDLKDGAHIGASALQGRMVYTDTVTDAKAVRVKKKIKVNQNLEMPSQELKWLNRSISDMIENDITVDKDGNVKGTLKNVEGFTDFSSEPSEQSGYYFPFSLTVTGSKMTFKKNGSETKKDIAFDKDIIFRTEKTDTWEVLVDGTSVVKLNFANATFAE